MGTVLSRKFYNGSIGDEYNPEMGRLLYSCPTSDSDSGCIIFTAPLNNQAQVVGIHQGAGTINGQRRAIGIFAFKILNAVSEYKIFVR